MITNYSVYEILMIVNELLIRGHKQLRLHPGMSPSGMAWRWMVYPKLVMKDDNLEVFCFQQLKFYEF